MTVRLQSKKPIVYFLTLKAIVTDTQTQLIWKRCAEGQSWDGSTCAGTATGYVWETALQRSNTPWRLPNIKELASIVERKCYDPAINATLFPATPSAYFWSSSPLANYNYDALGVGFYDGNDVTSNKNDNPYVRLVRSGQ